MLNADPDPESPVVELVSNAAEIRRRCRCFFKIGFLVGYCEEMKPWRSVLPVLVPGMLGSRVVGESTGPWLSHCGCILLKAAIPAKAPIANAHAALLLR